MKAQDSDPAELTSNGLNFFYVIAFSSNKSIQKVQSTFFCVSRPRVSIPSSCLGGLKWTFQRRNVYHTLGFPGSLARLAHLLMGWYAAAWLCDLTFSLYPGWSLHFQIPWKHVAWPSTLKCKILTLQKLSVWNVWWLKTASTLETSDRQFLCIWEMTVKSQ